MPNNRPSMCPLGDLVTLRTEKAAGRKDDSRPYIGLENMTPGAPDLVGSSPASASISTNNVFEVGDVLFGKLRPNLRKSVLAPFPGYCSTDIVVLRPIGDANASFAAKVFQSEPVLREAVATAIGTKMPRTSWSALREFKVFCPTSSEQRRIVEILDTADETIRQTERLIGKLQKMRHGLLDDLLTRGVDENGDLRDPERHPEQFKDSLLGRIPRSWEVMALALCCERVVDCPHSTPSYLTRGVLVARTQHIRDGRFDSEGASRVSEAEYKQRIARLEPAAGDVIFTREAPVGEAFLIPSGMRICLGQRVMLLRPEKEQLDGRYLVAQIYSDAVRRRISQLTGGTTNPHLNVSDVKSFTLPVPLFQEQTRIADLLDAFDDRFDRERQELEKLRSVKLGVMDDLLTGRLRTLRPQDEAAT